MNRVEKAALIEELVEKFSANVNFYITDASGMSVAETNNLRRLCFEARNRVQSGKEHNGTKKALEQLDTDYVPFDDSVLRGITGVMFSGEDLMLQQN